MATLHRIPRALLYRRPVAALLRPQTLAFPATSLRYASENSKAPKAKSLAEQFRRRQTPTIPQPDKYRPPSHGKRTPRSETPQKSYGPPLSEEDKLRMRTKKYPNMMSPEGTFSHWFLNNRLLHMYITLGILLSLGGLAWWMDFKSKTIYYEHVPSGRDFLYHPFRSLNTFFKVYKLHVYQQSQVAADMRLKAEEEIHKRRQYRLERMREAEERGEEYVEDPRYYIGEDGIRRRRVKRWFGIWE